MCGFFYLRRLRGGTGRLGGADGVAEPKDGSISSSWVVCCRDLRMAWAALAAAMAWAAVALIDGGGAAVSAFKAWAVLPFGTVLVSISPPPARRPTLSKRMATAVA